MTLKHIRMHSDEDTELDERNPGQDGFKEDDDHCCAVEDPRLHAVMEDRDPDADDEEVCDNCAAQRPPCTCQLSEPARLGATPRRASVRGEVLRDPTPRN